MDGTGATQPDNAVTAGSIKDTMRATQTVSNLGLTVLATIIAGAILGSGGFVAWYIQYSITQRDNQRSAQIQQIIATQRQMTKRQKNLTQNNTSIGKDIEYMRLKLAGVYTTAEARAAHSKIKTINKRQDGDIQALDTRLDRLEQQR